MSTAPLRATIDAALTLLPTPHEMASVMDRAVIDQSRAKRGLAIAVCEPHVREGMRLLGDPSGRANDESSGCAVQDSSSAQVASALEITPCAERAAWLRLRRRLALALQQHHPKPHGGWT